MTKSDGQPRSTYTPMRNPYRAHKLHKYRQAHGITVWTDAKLVQAHIEHLYAKGLTRAMIARAAGVHKRAIANIEDGTYDRTLNRVAAGVLAVTHKPHPRQELVPAVGAARRVRALNVLGWPTETLAARIGVNPQSLANSVRKGTAVTYRRWEQIASLYDELSATPGPSERARLRAKRNKWPAPLDWEYVDIDDPDATPEPAKAGPPLTAEERAQRDAHVLHAVRAGRTAQQIADDTGISIRTVGRITTQHRTKEAA